jgi:spore germination protein GerM
MKKVVLFFLTAVLCILMIVGSLLLFDRAQEPEPEDYPVTVYYVRQTEQGERLFAATHRADVLPGPEELFVRLSQDPPGDEDLTLIPEGTRLISSVRRQGLLELNFSPELASGNLGSTGEELLIWQLVNTMCSLDGVEEVRIVVGERTDLYGHISLEEPFSFREDLVIRENQ